MVAATQHLSKDVITDVIKANFPARIAFQVSNKDDSRAFLNTNGAEDLSGNGDMLFMPTSNSEPIRIHGSYISHEEIKRIVEHVKKQKEF